MLSVTFLPHNARVTVAAGTSLLDAAAAAGVKIFAPCGGEGACGDCRVRLQSGRVAHMPDSCLKPEELDAGWVLACGSRIVADVTIFVPEHDDSGAQIVTDSAGTHPQAYTAVEPLVGKLVVNVEAPSIENSFSDMERLSRAVKGAGGGAELHCNLGVLRTLAEALRKNGPEAPAEVTVSLDHTGKTVRIEGGNTTKQAHGLAIDIGTTTCAVQLVNLISGHVVGTASDYNGQIARGLDIISRINYAKLPERRAELRALVLGTLNKLICTLCTAHSVQATGIDNAAVAGNTTMIHLLLGLDPEYIRLAPYTPTANRWPQLRAGEVGLQMNPEAFVQLAPGIGSYVGGDITAGLLQTALTSESEQVRLFLDIGTNGEIVLGNGQWLMACACSAGPAFEGAGIGCGMRASSGAIERVRIDAQTRAIDYSVVGGGRPRGICGSGMIDLLAELHSTAMLDPSGKFDAAVCGRRVTRAADSARNQVFEVVAASDTLEGQAITLDERDIQNLLRTKAAVYSACALMLKSAGLEHDAIVQVYVAGGFGRFLDIPKAIRIGMLPDLPLERYTYLGNSSLAGARAMLSSKVARDKIADLAQRITYLELNVDPAYMDEYTAALFLPHTDLSRFPSARGR